MQAKLIGRVARPAIVRWGQEGGYFRDGGNRKDAFRDELTHLLVEQKNGVQSARVVWHR